MVLHRHARFFIKGPLSREMSLDQERSQLQQRRWIVIADALRMVASDRRRRWTTLHPIRFQECADVWTLLQHSQAISGFPAQPRLVLVGGLAIPCIVERATFPKGSRCPGVRGSPARPMAPGGQRQQLRPTIEDFLIAPQARFNLQDDPSTAQSCPSRERAHG